MIFPRTDIPPSLLLPPPRRVAAAPRDGRRPGGILTVLARLALSAEA